MMSYPVAGLGADGVWVNPLCQVNPNLPWCPTALPEVPPQSVTSAVAAAAAQAAAQSGASAPSTNVPGSQGTVAQQCAAQQQKPHTLRTLYSAELVGRGGGIFENSVMQCPTGEGQIVTARGGIFDGPNFGQECGYADKHTRRVPQAIGPQQPVPQNGDTTVPVGIGTGPDGLGALLGQRYPTRMARPMRLYTPVRGR
jgi:hypothetical protein